MADIVLLDLDGTLADSRPGIVGSIHATLRELGHDPTAAGDLTWAVGPPLAQVWARLMAQFGDDRVEHGITLYRQHYGLTGLYDATLYPGIATALEALYQVGNELVLATSKRRDFAARIIEHFGLAPRFLGVYGSEPGGALDSKADLIAHILRRENLTAADCVMVGDRLHDVEGAHANGIKTIGVLWGYGGQAELAAAGAAAMIDDPALLAAHVSALRKRAG